jgi:LmbE family N-acetylglucosaminyl deacetylase
VSVILVVAAHPDDEVLGVGATAARRAAAGDAVHLAILGEGATSRVADPGAADRAAVRALQDDARAVAGMLGAKSVAFGGLPDNRFDTLALLDIVKRVEGWVREIDLERYRAEHRAFPHPRSGEALRAGARRWGSVVGLPYAEAFELIRSVRS